MTQVLFVVLIEYLLELEARRDVVDLHRDPGVEDPASLDETVLGIGVVRAVYLYHCLL